MGQLGVNQAPISLQDSTTKRKCAGLMKGLLVIIIIHALAATAAHGQESLLAKLKGVKGLKVSLGADAAEPSVRMLCGEIGIERARVGFLRVGLLRFPVIRDMKLQLAEGSTTWASDLWAYARQEEWLGRAEIRGLTIVASENQMLLRAESAKLNASLATLDLQNVTINIDGHTTEKKFARISLHGSEEGILTLPDRQMKVIDLPVLNTPHENH